MPSHRRLLISYIALGVALIGAYFVLPEPFSMVGYLGASALAVVGLLIGILRFRPAWRVPWLLLIAGQAAFLGGDTLWYTAEVLGIEIGATSTADVLYLAAYPLLALGVLLFIKARQPRYTLTAGLDAIMLGTAGAALLWLFIGENIVHDTTLPLWDRAILLAYPLGDVLLLSAAAYLLLSGRQRMPAFVLLAVSLVTLLLADVGYALTTAASGEPASWPDGLWLASYLLFGLTALVPSMRQLTEPGDAPAAAESPRRFVLLGVSASILPLVALAQYELHGHVDHYFIIPAAAVVIVAGMLRMYELVRVHGRAEHRYASLLANASDAFAIVDADGILRYGSPAAEPVLGYGEGDIGGQSVLGLVASDDVPLASAMLAEASRTPGAQAETEVRVRRVDGAWRWLSVVATNRIDDPVVNGIVLNYRDVTARHEAEQRLRLQARVLEEVTHAVVVTDTTGHVTYWNQAAEAQFGWTAEEAQQRLLAELVQPEMDGQASAISRVLANGGRWSGELELSRKNGSRLTAMVTDSAIVDDDGSVRGIIAVSFDISDRKKLEQRLQQQAFTDALTGLANRALFLDRLTNALSRNERGKQRDRDSQPRLAVLFLDVDDFKTINDSLGHSAGDLLLIKLAERIQAVLRPGDTAARLGGDEFGVLLDGASLEDAQQVAERILTTVNEPLVLHGRDVRISTSLGIAQPTADGSESAEELLRNADLAMYEAKNSRPGTSAVYQAEMHGVALRRLQLKAALERAIATGGLALAFQPIVRLADGKRVGAEALLRWEHPELGSVPPPEAVVLATESGLMQRLGRWIISEALGRAREWHDAAGGDQAPFVSINATVGELVDAGYADYLAQAIHEHGLPPQAVQIELTEDALMSETVVASLVLDRLKAIGVRVAIDDFGTGYSSLNYLTRFPLDVLKIDRAFVRHEGAQGEGWAIARSIIELARSLDLEVIAEGIEHTYEAEALARMGCAFGQGYLLGEPVPAAEIAALMRPLPPPPIEAGATRRPSARAVPALGTNR